MQDQTVPHATITFDDLADVEPLTVPAGTTVGEITDQLQAAFLAADVIDTGHEFDITIGLDDGTVLVHADDEVIERGVITPVLDYWLSLADDLRQAADRLDDLAGTPAKDVYPSLHISLGMFTEQGWADRLPVIDAVAAVFDATASDEKSGGFWQRQARAKIGTLNVWPYTRIPDPGDAEKAKLRAELEELRAQLAQGGGTR